MAASPPPHAEPVLTLPPSVRLISALSPLARHRPVLRCSRYRFRWHRCSRHPRETARMPMIPVANPLSAIWPE